MTIRPAQFRDTHPAAAATVAAGLLAAGIAGIGLLPSSAAPSSDTEWTHVPSACSPDEASNGRYDSHVSAFKHARTATGQIVTRCNVVELPDFVTGNTQRMEVSYRDADGPGTRFQVRVELIQALANGATVVRARFNSNSYPAAIATTRRAILYRHAFDFTNSAYYVEVRVTRTRTSSFPEATTVRLTN